MVVLLTRVSHPVSVLVVLSVLAYALSYVRWRARTRGRPLPPGPKSLPYIGNVRHMSKQDPWNANRDLCREYGDVVYVPVMGQSIVLLGSPKSIHDLLEKQSAITSDRWPSVFTILLGHEFSFASMGYTPQWRMYRKIFSRHFNVVVDPYHLNVQWETSLMFLWKLLDEPERLLEHIHFTLSAAVITATYGIDIVDQDRNIGSLMEKVAEGTQAFSSKSHAISLIIQAFPILLHFPLWTPIVGPVLQFSAAARAAVAEAQQVLRAGTRKLMETGSSSSVLGKLLEEADTQEDGMQQEAHKIADGIALVAFEGASETSSSIMKFFFAAMALFPDVQRKAQAELDVQVGRDRLPNHHDRDALPYINALLKELLRWSAVLPAALPHHTSEDMEYNGYFIPKGSALIPQSWACMHDPEVYPEPERFMPERFLRKDGQTEFTIRDPGNFVFGYGRRVCPGRHFGEANLFINIVMVLHVLNIVMHRDEYGKPLYTDVKLKKEGGVTISPEDCRCTIEARSEQMLDLLAAAMQQ